MTTHECFDVTIENNIAHLVMRRPEKRNCMNQAFFQELPNIVSDIDENSRARVIVISSTGPHFSAGLDLSMFGDHLVDESASVASLQFYESLLKLHQSFAALDKCRIPIISAIQGGAIGGGLDLVTACDLRYATQDAFFLIQEINIGMTADLGTFPRLAQLIPEGIVREMAYTGQPLSVAKAERYGLVNQVFENHSAMLDAVMAVASDIANKAPMAIYGSKRMMNYGRDHSTDDALDYVSIWNASMLNFDEIKEAISANHEKRDAVFSNLPQKP